MTIPHTTSRNTQVNSPGDASIRFWGIFRTILNIRTGFKVTYSLNSSLWLSQNPCQPLQPAEDAGDSQLTGRPHASGRGCFQLPTRPHKPYLLPGESAPHFLTSPSSDPFSPALARPHVILPPSSTAARAIPAPPSRIVIGRDRTGRPGRPPPGPQMDLMNLPPLWKLERDVLGLTRDHVPVPVQKGPLLCLRRSASR